MDLWAGTRAWWSALDASIVKTGEQTPLFEIHLGKVSPPPHPRGERFLSILSTALK